MAAMDARMGPLAQPYPTLPASPTLTNPDMILPDYDLSGATALDDDNHHTRSQSPLMMWKNVHAAASSDNLQFFAAAEHHHPFQAGPITPTTPIIYGNGTMLSDIGEVTEAESTPGRTSRGSTRRFISGATAAAAGAANDAASSFDSPTNSRSSSPTPLSRHPYHPNNHVFGDALQHSSPTRGLDDGSNAKAGSGLGGVKQRARQQMQQQQQAAQDRARRDSIESNSTVTTENHAGLFADFSDTMSVGDSVFQGDDEESVAESYVEEHYMSRDVTMTTTTTTTTTTVATAAASLLAVPSLSSANGASAGSISGGNTSDEGDRRLSAATLSLRAEKILANAKKRLTTMEGNLNRARSSLYISSPSAGSLPSDGSTPSPRTPVRSATASSRYHDPSPDSPMHTRMVSDGSMPVNGIQSTNFPQRSASALGAAGGYRPPHAGATSASTSMSTAASTSTSMDRIHEIRDSLSGGYHRAGLSRPVDIVLERLEEDDDTDAPPSHARSDTGAGASASASADASLRAELPYLGPTLGPLAGDKGLTRSASVAQMRDLKDQMKDLKGKISSLREQARADSLKRRSLQSLRTPSPFTHAQVDQWYAEPQGLQEHHSGGSTNGRNPWNGEMSSVDDDHVAEHDEVAVVVTPPRPSGGAAAENGTRFLGSAYGSRSGSGDSRASVRPRSRSRRITPTAAPLPADQTDKDSVYSRYEESDDVAAVPRGGLSSSYSGHADRPRQSTESPVLGEADPSSAGETTPADDSDDLLTENGDFSDGDDPQQLEDVFVDSAGQRMDDIFDGDDDDAHGSPVDEDESFVESYDGRFDDPGEGVGDDGYESESGDSLYHDTLQHPVSHEDREDAFDYEHFILHSALGTISQQRLAGRSRRGSFSSEDSVETTRGPITSSSANHGTSASIDSTYSSPARRTSMSSISTVESADSFATATEGRTSRVNQPFAEDSDDVAPARSAAAKGPSHASSHASLASLASAASTTKRNSHEELRQTQKPSLIRRPASSAAMPGHRPSVSSFESTGTTRSFPLVNRSRMGSLSTISGGAVRGGSHSLSSSLSGSDGFLTRTTRSSSVGGSGGGSACGSGGRSGRGSSDNDDLRSIAESLMNETASICEQQQQQQTEDDRGAGRSRSLDGTRGVDHLDYGHNGDHGRAASAASVTSDIASHAQALESLSKEDRYLVERLVGNLGRCVLGLSEHGRASSESRAFRRRIDAARRVLEGLDAV